MEEKKLLLLNAVKTAASRYGIGAVSTRTVADIAGVSDSNIYRFFKDKDEMLIEAYKMSSNALINPVVALVDELHLRRTELHLPECARIIFDYIWDFFINNPDDCRFQVYYYNSPAYRDNVNAGAFHDMQVKQLISKLTWLFDSEQKASDCLHDMFLFVYDWARRVLDGERENNLETREAAFNIFFTMMYSRSNRAKKNV